MCSSSESSRFLSRKTTEESSRNMKSGWLFKGGVRLIEIIFGPKTNDYITTRINSKCQWKKMGGEREGINCRCPFWAIHIEMTEEQQGPTLGTPLSAVKCLCRMDSKKTTEKEQGPIFGAPPSYEGVRLKETHRKRLKIDGELSVSQGFQENDWVITRKHLQVSAPERCLFYSNAW